MDIKKTAEEIGLFELAVNLSRVKDSMDVVQKVGASMPLPDEDIEDRIRKIAKWLVSLNKDIYMFLMPEIKVIEEMSKITNRHIEIIITVPCDLEGEEKKRLKNNLPREIHVSVLEEPYFPQSFYPGNGVIVISGYLAGDRAMVLPDIYRMVEHYQDFHGKKVFVPYTELATAARYGGWIELNRQRLSTKWRDNHE